MGNKGRETKKKPKRKETPQQAKSPSHDKTIHPSKQPSTRAETSPSAWRSAKPAWRLGIMDFGGRWSWKSITSISKLDSIHDKLKSFETMQWNEIESKRNPNGSKQNGPVLVSRICPDAKKRLEDLRLDDTDHLYKLRLSFKERVWGIRDNENLKLLWYDPTHSVYPMVKK